MEGGGLLATDAAMVALEIMAVKVAERGPPGERVFYARLFRCGTCRLLDQGT